jgi:hypothetical protein
MADRIGVGNGVSRPPSEPAVQFSRDGFRRSFGKGKSLSFDYLHWQTSLVACPNIGLTLARLVENRTVCSRRGAHRDPINRPNRLPSTHLRVNYVGMSTASWISDVSGPQRFC